MSGSKHIGHVITWLAGYDPDLKTPIFSCGLVLRVTLEDGAVFFWVANKPFPKKIPARAIQTCDCAVQ